MDYKQLKKILCRHERKHPSTHLTAYITFSSFGPQTKRSHSLYSWEGRTYLISSDNKAFQPSKGGYSIFGSCLDKTSGPQIRLDPFMADEYGGKDGWVVEDCCIVGYLLNGASDGNLAEPELFYSYGAAHDRMLTLLADVGELEYEQLKAAFDQRKSVFEEDSYRVEQYDAWLTDHSTCDWMWNIQIVRIYSPLCILFGHD